MAPESSGTDSEQGELSEVTPRHHIEMKRRALASPAAKSGVDNTKVASFIMTSARDAGVVHRHNSTPKPEPYTPQ